MTSNDPSPAATIDVPAPRSERIPQEFPDSMPATPNGRGGAARRQRPSPAYDPLLRARLSGTAKWMMLAAILLFVAYFPTILYVPQQVGGDEVLRDPAPYSLAVVMAASIFATVFATGIPRLLLPGLFGRWHEAAEALRDWLIVGVLTGVVYWFSIIAARDLHVGPLGGPQDLTEWLSYRMPLLLGAGVIGLFAARALAIRRDGVLGSRALIAGAQILLQVALLILLERTVEKFFFHLSPRSPVVPVLGFASLVCALIGVGVVSWAFAADANLSTLRRRRGGTGVSDGSGPVSLTLTVIGGRESGKTVLLAAAFYEWSTQHLGNLRITPARAASGGPEIIHEIENLEDVARELYVNNQFPVGTVSTQNLPFDLSLGNEKIARFSFLDYPGGAIAGRVADASVVGEFWERVDDTDGIVMIADMSYVRRATKDSDWLEVRNAYRTVMQRLVDRNGKRRVVPVALVLTKCDEFVNPETGHIDTAALQAGLKEFRYDELETEWRHLNEEAGPGVIEFSTWITSAITYSQPQIGVDGRPDYSRPFQIAPAPPTIAPTGCASPLLWMTSKAMRWNVTLFYDINMFLFGSTNAVRRRVEAVLELERIASERAGRA
jgi:hypothetical protein